MKDFNYIPETAEELRDLKDFHGLSVYEVLDKIRELEYKEANKVKIPEYPIRPGNLPFFKDISRATSEELRKYANSIEAYEKKLKKYNEARNRASDLVKNAGPIVEEFIKLESEFYKHVPKKMQDKIYNKAVEDGHAYGFSEIYTMLVDLVDVFKD